MKLAEMRKLQRLAKAKTDGAKSRFVAVRQAQEHFIATAEAHAAQSAQPLAPDGEPSGGDFMLHGRYLAQLARSEKLCREAAKALEPEKAARKRVLQRSLGEESAWEKISSRAAVQRRAKMQEFDENRRAEYVLNGKGAEKPRSSDQ